VCVLTQSQHTAHAPGLSSPPSHKRSASAGVEEKKRSGSESQNPTANLSPARLALSEGFPMPPDRPTSDEATPSPGEQAWKIIRTPYTGEEHARGVRKTKHGLRARSLDRRSLPSPHTTTGRPPTGERTPTQQGSPLVFPHRSPRLTTTTTSPPPPHTPHTLSHCRPRRPRPASPGRAHRGRALPHHFARRVRGTRPGRAGPGLLRLPRGAVGRVPAGPGVRFTVQPRQIPKVRKKEGAGPRPPQPQNKLMHTTPPTRTHARSVHVPSIFTCPSPFPTASITGSTSRPPPSASTRPGTSGRARS